MRKIHFLGSNLKNTNGLDLSNASGSITLEMGAILDIIQSIDNMKRSAIEYMLYHPDGFSEDVTAHTARIQKGYALEIEHLSEGAKLENISVEYFELKQSLPFFSAYLKVKVNDQLDLLVDISQDLKEFPEIKKTLVRADQEIEDALIMWELENKHA